MATTGQDSTEEGESQVEQYTKGLSAVDTILHLDRLWQSVAVMEKLIQKSLLPGMMPIFLDAMASLQDTFIGQSQVNGF